MFNKIKITEALIKRSRPEFKFKRFDDTPVTLLSKPVAKSSLTLITTGGLHLKTDTPFDLDNREGDCTYRTIPGDVKFEDLHISHKWYNHKFINADLNCVFPIDRMREYLKKGSIGSLSEEHYSFMGHIYKPGQLIRNARKLGRHLKELGTDIAILTPT